MDKKELFSGILVYDEMKNCESAIMIPSFITDEMFKKIKPIETTSENLVRLGFKRNTEYSHDVYARGNIVIKGGDRFWFKEIELKYIHEVQVLLFLATKEIVFFEGMESYKNLIEGGF